MYPYYYRYMTMPAGTMLTDMLVEAMKDEKHDREKYRLMMEMAHEEKIKRQINFAYEDEGKHYKMFQNILCQLTGRTVDIPTPDVRLCDKLIENIETSIDGELEAVELYRKIKAMLPAVEMQDMLYEIITDEQEHATRFVYLYAIKE